MRKTIAAVALASSVAVGGLAGAIVGTPVLAGATETATGAVSWVQDARRGLVDDGTITQEQADRVETVLRGARPEGRFGHPRFARVMDLSVVAGSLGLSEDEVRTALQDGETIAEVAGEEGVDVQAVVNAIVAAHREHLDAEVADGDLTREQADEMLTLAEERAGALVNGKMPAFGGRHGHGGPRPGDFEGPGGAGDTGA